MKKLYAIVTFTVLLFVPPALAADVAGNWHLEMTGAGGLEQVDFTIKATGENLAITGEHSGLGKFEGGTGTLKDDAITMTFPLMINGTLVDFLFVGTVEGDKMEGTKKYQGHTAEKLQRGPTTMNLPEGWTAVRK